jgi:hypothetical protein
MEPLAVFGWFGYGAFRDATAADIAESGFDPYDIPGKRVPYFRPSGERDLVAGEHTRTAAQKSTWFGRRMFEGL